MAGYYDFRPAARKTWNILRVLGDTLFPLDWWEYVSYAPKQDLLAAKQFLLGEKERWSKILNAAETPEKRRLADGEIERIDRQLREIAEEVPARDLGVFINREIVAG